MIYHPYIAIIGRMHSDDESHVRTYENMTEPQARHQFELDCRHDADIMEVDLVAGYEFTNVYINSMLASASPITELEPS